MHKLECNTFNEGDEYWTLEAKGDEITLLNSIWDEISEELLIENPKTYRFKYLANAIAYLKEAGLVYVTYVNFRYAKPMNIDLTI